MAAHPYYPLALQLPNYVPMGVDHVYVLGIFSVATAIVIAVTWFVSGVWVRLFVARGSDIKYL